MEQIAAEKDITTRQLWQRVKKMAGWINSLSPTKFSMDEGIISKPLEMANLLNDFFYKKVNNICNQLTNKTICDPLALLKFNMNKWINKDCYRHFELSRVNPKRVRKLFKLLKNSKAEDYNGLSNNIIKMSREALIFRVTHLINQCIATNTWPTK